MDSERGARSANRAPFKAWLSSLGRDGSAALAAGEVYGSLAPADRDAWLDAVDGDLRACESGGLAAAYAPLLAWEDEPARRARILAVLCDEGLGGAVGQMRALSGVAGPREVVVLLRGLAFDLDEALVCVLGRGVDGELIEDARYLGLASRAEAERVAQEMGVSCIITSADAPAEVDRVALAIWAGARAGREAPQALRDAEHFFAPEREALS